MYCISVADGPTLTKTWQRPDKDRFFLSLKTWWLGFRPLPHRFHTVGPGPSPSQVEPTVSQTPPGYKWSPLPPHQRVEWSWSSLEQSPCGQEHCPRKLPRFEWGLTCVWWVSTAPGYLLEQALSPCGWVTPFWAHLSGKFSLEWVSVCTFWVPFLKRRIRET